MKPLHLVLTFFAGFGLATVIGLLVVVPVAQDAVHTNVESDVYRPLEGALREVEQSAGAGECENATAQLRLLNQRFAEFRSGGPAPADWWQDVIAATRPDDGRTP